MTRPQVPGHLALLAGRRRDGQPVYEFVPVRARPDGHWRLLGTPALAEGCAEGDVLAVDAEGQFAVEERGGNVAVLSYPKQGQTLTAQAEPLRRLVGPLGGKVEVPDDGRFLVVTLPVEVGFPAIQSAMNAWASESGCDWSYGNVYDENDQPLNWW